MINTFCKKPLWECSQTLAAVAQGREPADTVIKGAKLVNVCTAEIQEGIDVAVVAGRIAYVGQADHCIGKDTQVIDAQGQYIAPGFLDGHIHVESSMMGAGEYARAVVPHGTTGIYWDPHEVCNVLGLEGVKVMVEDAARTPLKAMVTTPSCVPAVPGFEDTGSFVGTRGHRGHHGVAERRGPRRDDELPRHPGRHRPRARRSGRDAQGREDRDRPLLDARDRPGPQRLRRLRRALLPRVHPRRRRAREDAPRHVCAAALRLGVEGPAGACRSRARARRRHALRHARERRHASAHARGRRAPRSHRAHSRGAWGSTPSPPSRWSPSTAPSASRWTTSWAPSRRASAPTSCSWTTSNTCRSRACSSTARWWPRTAARRSTCRRSHSPHG